MDIGEPQRTIIVEPAEDPIPRRRPAEPDPAPVEPQREPAREPEPVPAK